MEEHLPIDGIIAELKIMHEREPGGIWSRGFNLTESELERWSFALAITKRSELYNALALQLARGFHADAYSFEFCDDVINRLFEFIDSAREPSPELFWSVFLAFDAGEFSRDASADPVETHTRPQIAQILERRDRDPAAPSS